MDRDALESFVAAAETGALSRAARRIGISQPSITVRVRKLEEQLGAPLFERRGRGVALTDSGKALLPRANRILEEFRAAEETVRRGIAEGFGTLSVGAIPTVAPYVLPRALEHLRLRHPAARIELREDYSAVLSNLLADELIDVAIAALPYDFGRFDIEPLAVDRLLVAVPTQHPAARAGRITLEELQESPAVTLDPAHCLGAQVSGFCSARQVTPYVVCKSSQLATVFELVGANTGVSIVPAIAAARHNTPGCSLVPLSDVELERQIVAVWPNSKRRSVLAGAFVASVRAALNGAASRY